MRKFTLLTLFLALTVFKAQSQCSATLTATDATTPTTCSYSCDGSMTVNATYTGTGVLTYTFSTGVSSGNVDGSLCAGTVSYTVDDGLGCTTFGSDNITSPPAISISLVSSTNPSCSYSTDGSITVTASGGTGSATLTYSWLDGTSGVTDNNLAGGSYTVTVSDANSCTATATFSLTSPTAIVDNATVTNPLCNGDANGSISLSPTGGTGSYTYAWSDLSSGSSDNNLAGGSYTVTISDGNLCTATFTYTLTDPAAITISLVSSTNPLCTGDANGSITVTANGGTGSATLSYAWLDGTVGATDNNLSAGSYTVTVTDANSCTATATFSLTDPAALTIASLVPTNATSCSSNDGSIADAVVTGGTGSYTYAWSPGGQTTAGLSNLGPGTYTLTVTDANLCSATASATITAPNAPTLNSITETDVTCFGANDGTITTDVTGGSPPYSYNWSPSGSGASPTGLAGGTYFVTITDNAGCSLVSSIAVGEPTQIIDNSTVNDPSCNGSADGSVTLSPTGGAGGYSYAWSDLTSGNSDINLLAGTYSVTITDANTCTASFSYTLNDPAALVIAPLVPTNASTCGTNDGSIADASVTGGTGSYTYSWSPGGATTPGLTGLGAGTYTLTVTDANLCTATASATITAPNAPSLNSITSTDVSCFGGSDGTITTDVTGGTLPYSYNWSPSGSGANPTGLTAATYNVTVTDNAGCSVIGSVIVSQPTPINVSIVEVDVTCNGDANGSLDATGTTGGTGAYTYAWSGGLPASGSITGVSPGTYTVTITDANSCTATGTSTVNEPDAVTISTDPTVTDVSCAGNSDGSIIGLVASGGTGGFTYSWNPGGQTTSDISGLGAGTYTITIMDVNSCSVTASYNVNEPQPLVVIGAVSNTCIGSDFGAIDLTVHGGTPAYSYSWSGGAVGSNPTGLAAGSYTVTVTDANNCSSTASYTVNAVAPVHTSFSAGICTGSTYNFDGTTETATGTYNDTLLASNGCDSIVTLHLTVATSFDEPVSATICQGNSYNFNGNTLTSAGTYTDTFHTVGGCDSIVVLTLSVSAAQQTTVTAGICSGGTYSFNGQTLSASGTYTANLTSASGCDSTVTLILTVSSSINTITNVGICTGDFYNFNGQILTTSGSYIDTFTSVGGCDSIVRLNLSVNSQLATPVSASICNGDFYNFNGQNIMVAGTYNDTMIAVGGCDSIITLTLTVSPAVTTSNQSQSICPGSSYDFYGQTLTTAGTYYKTLNNVAGCDSVQITLVLSQTGTVFITSNVTSVSPYNFYGRSLTQSGTYYDTLSPLGCDTVVTLNLTITGINDLNLENAISLYPNPASDVLIVTSELFATGEVTPSVYDVTGKLVAVSFIRQANKFTFDTRELSSGMYWIKVVVDGNEATKKFVKIN